MQGTSEVRGLVELERAEAAALEDLSVACQRWTAIRTARLALAGLGPQAASFAVSGGGEPQAARPSPGRRPDRARGISREKSAEDVRELSGGPSGAAAKGAANGARPGPLGAGRILELARAKLAGRWVTAREIVEAVEGAEDCRRVRDLVSMRASAKSQSSSWVQTRKRNGRREFRLTRDARPESIDDFASRGGQIQRLPAAGSPELVALNRPVPASASDFPERIGAP